jgi:hypothetical protein
MPLAGDLGHRRDRQGGRRRRSGRSLARQHDPRPGARSGDARTAARQGRRGLFGTCAQANRSGLRLRLCRGGRSARGGDGRSLQRTRCAGARGCGSERGGARDDPVLGPGCGRPGAAGAGGRGRGPRRQITGFDEGRCTPCGDICLFVVKRDNAKSPANSAKCSRLTPGTILLDSCGSWSRPRRTRRRLPAP